MKRLTDIFPDATEKNWQNWRWQFKSRVTRLEKLASFLKISPFVLEKANEVTKVYPLAITPYYLSLIRPEEETDPIKAQCFPDLREISPPCACLDDPLEEDTHMPVPKLVHRYADRCLVIATEICATYCRHCNRKRFWAFSPKISWKSRMKKMIDYISASGGIREVILSGGDPLTLTDETLDSILSSMRRIKHVEVLRIGSRAPVVMPMRITRELCRILKRHRPLWFNTQFNHPKEITRDAARACNMIQEAGIPVSNQAVLLKGINDSAAVMKSLLHGLQKIAVRPYYLFHCDPARGCVHFRTDVQEGLQMMDKIWRQCSGLCLPQYVMDVPGDSGKIPLSVQSKALKKELHKHQHFFDKSSQID